MNAKSSLLSRLDSTPVLGVSMANVCLLRLDLCDTAAPGNKWFKLQQNIADAQKQGMTTLLSFGGAWSNHLHALAATGFKLGLQTIGIVRGEQPAHPSAMLCDAQTWGMQLVYVSRQEYRKRSDPAYLAGLEGQFGPCTIVPEGGANRAGVKGCMAIADILLEEGVEGAQVVLAVGTGTTLAGVAMGLGAVSEMRVTGISVLKGAFDLDESVSEFVDGKCADWKILHNHHCGGYARVSPGLREFILAFETTHQIPLDPVYTGKALYGVHQLLLSGQWAQDQPVVFIHTGGLQGRRGFDWLEG